MSLQEVVKMMPQLRLVIEREPDICRPFPSSVAHVADRGVETDG